MMVSSNPRQPTKHTHTQFCIQILFTYVLNVRTLSLERTTTENAIFRQRQAQLFNVGCQNGNGFARIPCLPALMIMILDPNTKFISPLRHIRYY